MARLVLHYLRNWDVHSHHRVDHFIANSATAARRIEKIYGRKAEVIYPPVRTECFDWRKKREDYYLVVSRLVPYKRVDLIVKAFQQMPEKKLIVIGEGPELSKIKAKAGKNTEFLGYQKDEIVKDFLEKARAFIFAAEEDFGIAPVEALASGTPVIAYGKGGVTESVKEGISGLFFEAQSCESLIRVLNLFEKTRDSFDPERIQRQAERFSAARFREKFQDFVEKKQQEFLR
jgi:glycosyltransferase involved in cell wall biosynthesis